MSSRKSKNKSNNNSNSSYLRTDIDYDKLAEAIVIAHQRIIDIEKKESDKRRKEEKEQWYSIIGYKEYATNENLFVKKYHNLKNGISAFKTLLLFKKENAKSDKMTFVLFQMATSFLFSVFKWIFYFMFVIFGINAIYHDGLLQFNLKAACWAILSFVFARIFRIAVFEIDNLQDREYLLAILSTVTSFVAMLLAIIALFVR